MFRPTILSEANSLSGFVCGNSFATSLLSRTEVNGESRNQKTPGEKKHFHICKVAFFYIWICSAMKGLARKHMMSDLEKRIKNETPNNNTQHIFIYDARWHRDITYVLSNLHKTMKRRRNRAKAFLTWLLRGVLAMRLRIKVYIDGTISRKQIKSQSQFIISHCQIT